MIHLSIHVFVFSLGYTRHTAKSRVPTTDATLNLCHIIFLVNFFLITCWLQYFLRHHCLRNSCYRAVIFVIRLDSGGSNSHGSRANHCLDQNINVHSILRGQTSNTFVYVNQALFYSRFLLLIKRKLVEKLRTGIKLL